MGEGWSGVVVMVVVVGGTKPRTWLTSGQRGFDRSLKVIFALPFKPVNMLWTQLLRFAGK